MQYGTRPQVALALPQIRRRVTDQGSELPLTNEKLEFGERPAHGGRSSRVSIHG